jgi:BirA family biotin operon repressor/biotin-[acetyl-CoA-carboxylase] ligase
VNKDGASETPVPFAVPERLAEIDSTNRYLGDLVRTGLADSSEVPEGYAVIAERQSKGRGRLARTWEAPAGSAVLCSILFKPELVPDQLHLTAWAVALAAVQACREAAGVASSLKWPNDLLCAELKVAGILSEIVPGGATTVPAGSVLQAPASVVVGIGINVNWPPEWPPTGSRDPELASLAARATALNRVAGREIDRGEVVSQLLAHAESWNTCLANDQGRRSLASEYRRCCSTIGREVRVEMSDETVSGRALDVDDSGCLLVSTGACIRTISAGDVVHLR